jgi:DinB superfamily
MTQTSLTMEQIAKASDYLAETRDALVESATGLSTSEWAFKPGSDCWSINQIVEHLVLIENAIQGLIGKMSEAPEAPPGFEPLQMDDLIVATVPKRSGKAKSPPHLVPADRWNGPQALEQFVKSREQTLRLLSTATFLALPLRGRVRPHPIFGPWDGYHWILATAAHCARHTAQIHELKAEPDFLQTSDAAATLQ